MSRFPFSSTRSAIVRLALAGTLALALTGGERLQPDSQELAQADGHYAAGQFDTAAAAYGRIAAKDASSYGAVLGLARVAMLRNDLPEAGARLKQALALKPQEREPQALMGELHYRRNEFAAAAPFFEAVGQKAKAEKMRAFEARSPFLIEAGPDVSALKFVQTDPLPQITLTVNGQEGTFLIDTGAWELHVMPPFASKCGLKPLSEMQTGTYAGGRQAATAGAVADRVLMGDFTLRDVPVVIPQGPRGPMAVDGIVGTVLLKQFLFTLDYPGGQLILRRNTPDQSKAVRDEAAAAGALRVPFWLAGDHFIYAWGTANGAGPFLFLVDTGMGGGGFSCPEDVIKEAKIELPKEGFQGMGGGGPITVYPFTVDLTLGEARVEKVQGFFGALPPGSESRHGFRTGGIISHGFFRPFALTFDFQAMAIYLKKPA